MYALLDLSNFVFIISIAFFPVIGHPTLEDESLFYSEPGSLEPLPDGQIGAADAFNTDQNSMADVPALSPPYTGNPDVSLQASTDIIGMNALNLDPLNSLNSPFLLAAEGGWDWDCPEGKQSYCCSERNINPSIPTDFGGCRNCGSLFSPVLTLQSPHSNDIF